MPRFHVQRSINIDAPPQQVFDTVADFGTWTSWSPWLCAEPTADVTVTDNANSVGSVYAWKGEVVGQGEIEHKQLEPGRLIDEEIRFVKPFKSRSDVKFELEPAGEGTRITWHMHGSLPWFLFFMKSMMEPMIGMDYDRGLKMLKEYIETGKVLANTTIKGIESVGPLQMAGVRKQCALKDVSDSMKAAFEEADQKFAQHNLPTDGEQISVYHNFDMKAQTFDYTSGYVLPESTNDLPAELSHWSIPVVNALAVEHAGSYAHLGNSWSAANQYARYKKLKQSKAGAFEIYRNDSCDTDPADLKTDIYLPLK